MIITFIIYLGFLFITIFLVWISKLLKNAILRKAAIFLSFFNIILISGLRGPTVGVDNYEYSEWFRLLNIENGLMEAISTNIIDYEPGFVLINYFIKTVNLNYNYALILYSILIWSPIFIFFKHLKDFHFAIFSFLTLGFLFFAFNGQRQAIAQGFIFLGVYFLIDKKKYHFLLSIISATMFHFSAILLLSIFFINKISKLPVYIWFVGIIGSLIIPLSLLFGIIEKIAELFPYYGSYIENDNFKQANSISAGVLYQVLFELIVLYFYKNFAKTKLEILFFNLFFIGAIMYNMFYGNLFLNRIVVYFLFFQPFVISIILSKLNFQKKYLEILSILLALFALFVYKILYNDSGCSPYVFSNYLI